MCYTYIKDVERMTKYQKIADIIESKILNLEYQQGKKLPSIKDIMKVYHCSRSTAIKCYECLINKHLVYVKPQSGYYVADSAIKPSSIDDKYALNTGNPIVSATSLVDAKHCLSIAIEQYSQSSLNISLQGVDSLRQILPDFLAQYGIYAKNENIYLIQGITQILSFLSINALNHQKYILIEEPTYSYYIQFLKSLHIPTLTIKRDENGIDLHQLELLFQQNNIQFFYTIPRNHNPLGTTLNTQTRKKIAELAIKYNVCIIEDDYFGHCSSTAKYLPIHYYSSGQNCIYLTSFSKTIPYIRIGICVIPQHLKETFEQIIHQSYYFSYQMPSLISQATLESYIRSLLYQKQVQRLQQQLKKHYQVIKKITQSWDHHIVSVIGGTSGYYFSLSIHSDISLDRLENELKKRQIYIARNERCFYDISQFNHTLRLSIARVTPSQLEEALNIIYDTLMSIVG